MKYFVFVCFIFFCGKCLSEAGNENQFWTCEKELWQAREDFDFTKFMSLIHPDFQGWPPKFDSPANKKEIATAFKPQFDKSKYESLLVSVKPLRIAVYGDIAVTHFILSGIGVMSNSENISWSVNETHVWDYSSGKCLLLGGMGRN